MWILESNTKWCMSSSLKNVSADALTQTYLDSTLCHASFSSAVLEKEKKRLNQRFNFFQ